VALNLTAAYAVEDPSQVAEPRRSALWLAERCEFSDERAGRVALVTSELATNLAKHATKGEMLLRPLTLPSGELDGIEILAIDQGPGIPDVALSRRDGYSTTGTLGHGLGAIARQADAFDLYTNGRGTVAVARICRERTAGPPPREGIYEIGAVQVAKPGEDICGDAWSWRMREGRLAIFAADGLGHGLSAHDAAAAAVDVFVKEHEEVPSRVIQDVHAALRATRGAAVAMLAIDVERRTATFSGLGNIAGTIVPPAGGRHNLVSLNGTAGHTAGRIHDFSYPVAPRSIVVIASDGLGTHWDLAQYPGLTSKQPSVIAGVLYRDHSRRRDDVTVIVARERTAISENE
jgi:anti-sigma regulatory factor (Ser/Thr protein kinase)